MTSADISPFASTGFNQELPESPMLSSAIKTNVSSNALNSIPYLLPAQGPDFMGISQEDFDLLRKYGYFRFAQLKYCVGIYDLAIMAELRKAICEGGALQGILDYLQSIDLEM